MSEAMGQTESKDFFISDIRHERAWAEWIVQQLEQEGYTTIIQSWDARPWSELSSQDVRGLAHHQAHTAGSFAHFSELRMYPQPEWAATFVRDPRGLEGLLVPVKVRDCQLDGLLAPLAHIMR